MSTLTVNGAGITSFDQEDTERGTIFMEVLWFRRLEEYVLVLFLFLPVVYYAS